MGRFILDTRKKSKRRLWKDSKFGGIVHIDIEIITVCCRPAISALIGWGKTSQVAPSLLRFYDVY